MPSIGAEKYQTKNIFSFDLKERLGTNQAFLSGLPAESWMFTRGWASLTLNI